MSQTSKTQLAAILFSDIEGYSSIMHRDRMEAVDTVEAYKKILEQKVSSFNGQVLNDYGDGSLSIFSSATDAVRCAMEMQQQFRSVPVVPLRIGIHIGEILFKNGQPFGDGVNIASRIESLGQAGTVFFSRNVYNQIRNLRDFDAVLLGKFEFKNIEEPIEVFALANEGFPVPKAAKLSGKLKGKPKKSATTWIWGLIGLLIVVGVVAWSQWPSDKGIFNSELPTSFENTDKSIAVLPFKDLSPGIDQGYFSDGMFDEIRNRLHKIDGLRIASRTSSMRYKEISNKTIKEIGNELNVNHVLEGSVRKHENNLRITVTLVDVETDSDLWSERFDRELKDVFKIQSDIANHIAQALEAEISPEAKAAITAVPTLNSRAYDLYLKGKSFTENYLHSGNEKDFETAIKLLREVISIDSNFASAYVEMGFAFQWKEGVAKSSFRNIIKNDFLLVSEEKLSSPETVSDTVLILSNKAISLNSGLSRAYQLRAWAHWGQDEVSKAIDDCKQAVLLDPDDELGYKFLGIIYMTIGEFEKAYLNYSKCFELSIYYRPIDYSDVGQLYLHIGEFGKAKFYFEKSLEVLPNFYWGYNTLSWLHAVQGNFEKSAFYSKQGIEQFPAKAENYIIHAHILALSKKFDVAEEYLLEGLSMMDERLEITKPMEGAYIFWMNDNKKEATNRFQKQITYALKNIELGTNYGLKRSPYDLAAANAFLGNTEEAYKWLKRYSELGFKGGLEKYIWVDPHFQNLRNDTRFQKILETEEVNKSRIRAAIKKLEIQKGTLLE